jgi:DNA-binding XRE family transcriptional regulator
MEDLKRWEVTKAERDKYMRSLAAGLAALRAKAGISQGDLAAFIGVSRQTYSAIETGKREMTWGTYLSLILFFDYCNETHRILRSTCIFPEKVIVRMNGGNKYVEESITKWADALAAQAEYLSALDDKGMHAVHSMMCLEYERCTGKSAAEASKALARCVTDGPKEGAAQ